MPLQNRVDPFGAIVADPARGTMMGNRGRLHDAAREIGGRRWTTKAWICCRLSFRGRQRTVMAPDSYTELFFLDEATAFAAGHRPCYECRRADYTAFLDTWSRGNRMPRESLRAGDVDRCLHEQRVGPKRTKPTFGARLGDLPAGAFVVLPDRPGIPWLLWDGRLHRWTPAGYRETQVAARDQSADVLTPKGSVNALAAGFLPAVHPSAGESR